VSKEERKKEEKGEESLNYLCLWEAPIWRNEETKNLCVGKS